METAISVCSGTRHSNLPHRQLGSCCFEDPCYLYTCVVISIRYFSELGAESESVILVDIAKPHLYRGCTVFPPMQNTWNADFPRVCFQTFGFLLI